MKTTQFIYSKIEDINIKSITQLQSAGSKYSITKQKVREVKTLRIGELQVELLIQLSTERERRD